MAKQPSLKEYIEEFFIFLPTYSDNAPGTIVKNEEDSSMGDHWNNKLRKYFAALIEKITTLAIENELPEEIRSTIPKIMQAIRKQQILYFVRATESFNKELQQKVSGCQTEGQLKKLQDDLNIIITSHFHELLDKESCEKFSELEKIYNLCTNAVPATKDKEFMLTDEEITNLFFQMTKWDPISKHIAKAIEFFDSPCEKLLQTYRMSNEEQDDTVFGTETPPMHRSESQNDFGCAIGTPWQILMGGMLKPDD